MEIKGKLNNMDFDDFTREELEQDLADQYNRLDTLENMIRIIAKNVLPEQFHQEKSRDILAEMARRLK